MTAGTTTVPISPGRVLARGYLWVLSAEGLVLVTGLALFRLVALRYGVSGFGFFQLSRGLVSSLQPLVLLGLGVGVPRFVAFEAAVAQRSVWLRAALPPVIASTLVAAGLIVGLRDVVARELFGDPRAAAYIVAAAAQVAGLVVYTLAYAYLRGGMRLRAASLLSVTNLACLPLALLFVAPSLPTYMLMTAMAWASSSGAVIVLLLTRARPQRLEKATLRLLRYGVPRVPGDVALLLLFFLPAAIASRRVNVATAGFVGFSTSLIALVGSAVSPVGVVLLPWAAGRLSSSNRRSVVTSTRTLLGTVLIVSLLFSAIVAVAAPTLVRLYLGADFLGAVAPLRMALLAVLPFSVFLVGRSVLDAADARAVNTRNLLISLVAYLLCTAAIGTIHTTVSLMFPLVAAVWCLGFLTVVVLARWRLL